MNNRNFIKSMLLVGASASVPTFPKTALAKDARATADAPPDLADDTYVSPGGHGFMSDAIHLGEQPGFSVTPIYQAKNVNGGYQRPPHNPTVGGLEVKTKSPFPVARIP